MVQFNATVMDMRSSGSAGSGKPFSEIIRTGGSAAIEPYQQAPG
jgi:hypothetical protein